ncbi:hypothetical protein TNCV_1610121 [Trichonephila clavipes]|nr:hypothetical protein TNCV_1610121 [Trichonephila clavipes]
MPSSSSSVSTVSTSSLSTLLPICNVAAEWYRYRTVACFVTGSETRSLTTPNKFNALSTEIQPLVPLPESDPTTSNIEHSNEPKIPQCVKRSSRNRKKRPKVQKPEIEIKMAPHRPRKDRICNR